MEKTSAEESYTLENPHEWNSIDIDLTQFPIPGQVGKLKSIQLSGGTGEERRIYLDHIYLYQKTVVKPDPEDPDPEDPDPEDEPAPLLAGISADSPAGKCDLCIQQCLRKYLFQL